MDRDHRTLEVAFVTGANQGIGFHTALQLCKLPGYHIIVGTRTRDAGKETIQRLNAAGVSSEVCFIVMDLDSDASIASAVGQILMKFGRLDILVNNAGAFLDEAMANKSIRETFMATYSTNVFGVATLIKSCLPLLKQSNFPRIVNVTSGLGSLTIMSDWNSIWASARHPAYNTSKTALNPLTVHYAWVLAQEKPCSRVVSIDPGYTATRLNDYEGTQDPSTSAAGVVRVIVAPFESNIKSGELRDQFGNTEPW